MPRPPFRRSLVGIAPLMLALVEATSLTTLPGCSPSDTPRDDALPLPPASCGSRPSLGEARARLGGWPSSTTLEAREVKSVMLGSIPFGPAKPGEDRARLFADEASYRAFLSFRLWKSRSTTPKKSCLSYKPGRAKRPIPTSARRAPVHNGERGERASDWSRALPSAVKNLEEDGNAHLGLARATSARRATGRSRTALV
jgi:hypothetical protein